MVIQLENLRTYPCVIDGEQGARLQLHGWLYDLHTGSIRAIDPMTRNWEPISHRPAPPDSTGEEEPRT